MTDITDHEDPDPQETRTVAVEALPFPFADNSHASLWMWCFMHVMQHPETPLTDKTLKFVMDSYRQACALMEGKTPPVIEIVK